MSRIGSSLAYTPIHLRSYFSLLRGCLSPEAICRLSREKGASAVGVADINNLYGLVRFSRAAAHEGIKPVAAVVIAHEGIPLFTAYIMERQGLCRVNRLLTSLLLHESPHACGDGACVQEQWDPIEVLLEEGWEGLRLVSDNTQLLERLCERSPKGLYVRLTFERPIGSLASWARSRGLPPIAVNEGVCSCAREKELYKLLRAIDLNTTVDQVPYGQRISSAHVIASDEQMQRHFSAVPEALRNTRVLADEADSGSLLNRGYVFPSYRGMSEQEALRRLGKLCQKGIIRRYGSSSPAIQDRLALELDIIAKKGFASYFMVVHDIVSRCPRTCGRGSSASSLVSFLLGVTHVDPLRYNLFFQRFLNLGRRDPPDIDVDFPWDERNKVLEYVFSQYAGRSAMVANYVRLGRRASIRETAKALGAEKREIGRLIRLSEIGREQQIPAYIRKMAERVEGFPRYIGTHCGGVVITPDAITNHSPIQLSARGYPVIAWDKESAEHAGLVKIDLLGNRSLAVLRDTLELVQKRHARRIEWEGFNPLNDAGTRKMIERGNTIGVFYVESPATRQLLKKMRRGDYEHLVIASSIIRPAANLYIRQFVERLHGRPYQSLHPMLANILGETYGIMVYQEDVSRVAMSVAGLSAEEADRLRKVISKGHCRHQDNREQLQGFRERFLRGGEALGVGRAALEEIWRTILSFREYSFCKAHSASFALVSYKLAYLKRYYPLEFMVSVINNGGGYYSSQTYLNECKRMGFDVLAPDINRSRMHYAPEGNAIRIGFRQLRELRGEFIQTLLRERRQGGEFRSFVDFLNRCAPRISDLRILVRSGALDSLSDGVTRPALFWIFFRQSSLGEMLVTLPLPASIGDYSEHTKLLDEVRTLGVMVSRHPLELFARRISSLVCPYPLITSKELAGHRMRRVSIAGLLVTGKEVWTRTNEVMTFVSFEDRYSVFESVFFPAAFRRFCHLLDQIGVFLLSGRVDEDHGVLCINVENLARLSGSDLAPRAGSFRIVSGTQKGPVVQWPVPANPLAAKTRTSI